MLQQSSGTVPQPDTNAVSAKNSSSSTPLHQDDMDVVQNQVEEAEEERIKQKEEEERQEREKLEEEERQERVKVEEEERQKRSEELLRIQQDNARKLRKQRREKRRRVKFLIVTSGLIIVLYCIFLFS